MYAYLSLLNEIVGKDSFGFSFGCSRLTLVPCSFSFGLGLGLGLGVHGLYSYTLQKYFWSKSCDRNCDF